MRARGVSPDDGSPFQPSAPPHSESSALPTLARISGRGWRAAPGEGCGRASRAERRSPPNRPQEHSRCFGEVSLPAIHARPVPCCSSRPGPRCDACLSVALRHQSPQRRHFLHPRRVQRVERPSQPSPASAGEGGAQRRVRAAAAHRVPNADHRRSALTPGPSPADAGEGSKPPPDAAQRTVCSSTLAHRRTSRTPFNPRPPPRSGAGLPPSCTYRRSSPTTAPRVPAPSNPRPHQRERGVSVFATSRHSVVTSLARAACSGSVESAALG